MDERNEHQEDTGSSLGELLSKYKNLKQRQEQHESLISAWKTNYENLPAIKKFVSAVIYDRGYPQESQNFLDRSKSESRVLYGRICDYLREMPGEYPVESIYHLSNFRPLESPYHTLDAKPFVCQFVYQDDKYLFKPFVVLGGASMQKTDQITPTIEIRKDEPPIIFVPEQGIVIYEYTEPSRIDSHGTPEAITYSKMGAIYTNMESLPRNITNTLLKL